MNAPPSITATLASIFTIIGIFGMIVGIGIGIYSHFKPDGQWQEAAHDVCGRAILFLIAGAGLYVYSQQQ